jgi:hypothetical protein
LKSSSGFEEYHFINQTKLTNQKLGIKIVFWASTVNLMAQQIAVSEDSNDFAAKTTCPPMCSFRSSAVVGTV